MNFPWPKVQFRAYAGENERFALPVGYDLGNGYSVGECHGDYMVVEGPMRAEGPMA